MPLITIEGIDGAGKTTLAAALEKALRGRGTDVVLLREPGGVALSERIRALVKDPSLTISPRAETLLFAAARAQLVEEAVRPALDAGRTVLLDRFVDSSLAYQGGGRALGLDAVAQINAFALDGLQPDRTLLLRIDPARGRDRQDARGTSDRMEQERDAFFTAIADAYDELARRHPERIVVLDAGAPPEAVLAAALGELSAA